MARIETDGSRALRAHTSARGAAAVFARAVGVGSNAVSLWVTGVCRPKKKWRDIISKETGIAPEAWGPPRPRGAPAGTIDVDLGTLRANLGEDVRPLAFAAGYYVTETGKVFRATKRLGVREVRPWVASRGRKRAILHLGEKQKAVSTARLVALAFLGSPPDDAHNFVCHRNDDPSDDRVANLYWGTAKDNCEDMLRNERIDTGFTNARAARALKMAADGATVGEVADRFGVNHATALRLLTGKTWQHIPGPRVVNERDSITAATLAGWLAGEHVVETARRAGTSPQRIREMRARLRRRGEIPRTPPAPPRCGVCADPGHNAARCPQRKAA